MLTTSVNGVFRHQGSTRTIHHRYLRALLHRHDHKDFLWLRAYLVFSGVCRFVPIRRHRHTQLVVSQGAASMRVLRKWPQLLPRPCSSVSHRTILGLASKKKIPETDSSPKPKKPILEQDNLFHPLSRSPFPALRARAEAVKSMAPCPVCLEEHGERRPVHFDCPDCGWPTHDSAMHWDSDKQHSKYCSRLRETNEDEHDLRSGRRIWEFDLPGLLLHYIYASALFDTCLTLGEQQYEGAVSFANWDTYWYTRNHPSINEDRSRRHLTKLLTYPVTISSVLHEFSGLTTRNQRVTPEGARSLAGKMAKPLHSVRDVLNSSPY